MSAPKSTVGCVLAATYLLIAAWVAIEDLRGGGGLFNLQGLATYFVTFPVSFLFFKLLPVLGIDDSRFSIPLHYSFTTLITIAVFIGLCTALVYMIGAAIEFGIRKLTIARR